jgi:hypothetical protein
VYAIQNIHVSDELDRLIIDISEIYLGGAKNTTLLDQIIPKALERVLQAGAEALSLAFQLLYRYPKTIQALLPVVIEYSFIKNDEVGKPIVDRYWGLFSIHSANVPLLIKECVHYCQSSDEKIARASISALHALIYRKSVTYISDGSKILNIVVKRLQVTRDIEETEILLQTAASLLRIRQNKTVILPCMYTLCDIVISIIESSANTITPRDKRLELSKVVQFLNGSYEKNTSRWFFISQQLESTLFLLHYLLACKLDPNQRDKLAMALNRLMHLDFAFCVLSPNTLLLLAILPQTAFHLSNQRVEIAFITSSRIIFGISAVFKNAIHEEVKMRSTRNMMHFCQAVQNVGRVNLLDSSVCDALFTFVKGCSTLRTFPPNVLIPFAHALRTFKSIPQIVISDPLVQYALTITEPLGFKMLQEKKLLFSDVCIDFSKH